MSWNLKNVRFSLAFLLLLVTATSIVLAMLLAPTVESITLASSVSAQLNDGQISNIQLVATNEGLSSIWTNTTVNNRPAWVQIYDIIEGKIQPISGTGGGPCEWRKLPPGKSTLIELELAGCCLETNREYVFSFQISDWRARTKWIFGAMTVDQLGKCHCRRWETSPNEDQNKAE